MKEALIVITIIIIIIGADLILNNYLKQSSKGLLNSLEELKGKINKNEEGIKELEVRADKIYHNWNKVEEKWAMLVLHSELDQIETALIKTKSRIKEYNLKDCLEEIETSIFLINHISEKEKFCLKNVF